MVLLKEHTKFHFNGACNWETRATTPVLHVPIFFNLMSTLYCTSTFSRQLQQTQDWHKQTVCHQTHRTVSSPDRHQTSYSLWRTI